MEVSVTRRDLRSEMVVVEGFKESVNGEVTVRMVMVMSDDDDMVVNVLVVFFFFTVLDF